MEKKIKEIIATIKDDPSLVDTLSDDASIIQEAGLDSLQIINFVLNIEDVFCIEFDFDNFDYSHIRSIRAFSQYVLEHKRINSVAP